MKSELKKYSFINVEKTFLILFMFEAHALFFFDRLSVQLKFIHALTVPGYCFLAGYLYRKSDDLYVKLKNKIFKFIPLYVYCAILSCYFLGANYKDILNILFLGYDINVNLPLWFFSFYISLNIMYIILSTLTEKIEVFLKNDMYKFIIKLILIIVFIWIISLIKIDGILPLKIYNFDIAVVMIPIMFAGEVIRYIETMIDNNKKYNHIYIIFLFIMLVIFVYSLNKNDYIDIYPRFYGKMPLFYAECISGGIVFLNISKIITMLLDKMKLTKVFEFVGKNAVFIMCFHVPGFEFANNFLLTNTFFHGVIEKGTIYRAIIYIAISIIFSLFFSIPYKALLEREK